jgi:phosphohistidine phosphatase
MKIYLVQHGEAKSEEDDPERPLSEKGVAELGKVAKHAVNLVSVSHIYHSPKLRAKQSAQILMSATGAKASESEGLKPNDDPDIARYLIETEGKNIMLVGHLPHLERLSSLLLTGDPEGAIISFRMGAIVCLEKEDKWRIKWILTPEMVK